MIALLISLLLNALTVRSLNDEILDMLPGPVVELFSTDEIRDTADDLYLPVEQLHSLTPSGLPHHVLRLKVGAVVMLLRNMDLASGLSNGTRMKVLDISKHVLKCEILCGQYAGNVVFLPKLDITCSSRDTPVPFTRNQFPIRLAFAMTINKAQGDTFDWIVLYLTAPVFAHGQLYVAMSRVKSRSNIKICLGPHPQQGKTGEHVITLNKVDRSVIAAFREHLMYCNSLPRLEVPSFQELLQDISKVAQPVRTSRLPTLCRRRVPEQPFVRPAVSPIPGQTSFSPLLQDEPMMTPSHPPSRGNIFFYIQ
jgi:PIF1-like helicase